MRLWIAICLLLALCATADRARSSLRETLTSKLTSKSTGKVTPVQTYSDNDCGSGWCEINTNPSPNPACNLVPYPAVSGTIWQMGACWTFEGEPTDMYIMSFEGVFQDDGNLVSYDSNMGVAWASSTGSVGASYLSVQSDGNVVIYTANNVPLWATNTAGNGPSYFALIYGQLYVIQQSTNKITWISPITGTLSG